MVIIKLTTYLQLLGVILHEDCLVKWKVFTPLQQNIMTKSILSSMKSLQSNDVEYNEK